MTTIEFSLPKPIADILLEDQTILSLSGKQYTYPKAEKRFIKEKRVELAVFYNDLFKINQSDSLADRRRKPIITSYKQMPFERLQKLFGSNDLVSTIKKFSRDKKIISTLKNVCTSKKYKGKWRETYRSTVSAREWAEKNGHNPDLAFGQAKSFKLRSGMVSHVAIHGLVDLKFEVTEKCRERIQKYYEYFEEQDYNKSIKLQRLMVNKFEMPLSDERIKEIQKICDRDAHKPFEEREIKSYKHYQNVFDKKVNVYQKDIVNRRVITDHALIKKEDLSHLVTEDGYNAVEIDISASKPSFHINMLHQFTDGDSAYNDLYEAVSTGDPYELMIKITGDKYIRDKIKKAYSTVASTPYESGNWDGIIGDLNRAIAKYYPKWIELLKYNSSPEAFKHTIGRSRFKQIDNEKSYDYYNYTIMESWFMQSVIKEIISQLGLIPLTSKYDCIIVGTNNIDEVYKIMKQVSDDLLPTPLHFKIHYFNEDDIPIEEEQWDESEMVTSDDILQAEIERELAKFKRGQGNGEYGNLNDDPITSDTWDRSRVTMTQFVERKLNIHKVSKFQGSVTGSQDEWDQDHDLANVSFEELKNYGCETSDDVDQEEVDRALAEFKREHGGGEIDNPNTELKEIENSVSEVVETYDVKYEGYTSKDEEESHFTKLMKQQLNQIDNEQKMEDDRFRRVIQKAELEAGMIV